MAAPTRSRSVIRPSRREDTIVRRSIPFLAATSLAQPLAIMRPPDGEAAAEAGVAAAGTGVAVAGAGTLTAAAVPPLPPPLPLTAALLMSSLLSTKMATGAPTA